MTPAEIWASLRTEADGRLVDRFHAYHRAHPEVWQAFKRYATAMRASGRKRYSAWPIMNRIRWEHDIQVGSGEFKINNNFIGLYARALMKADPTFDGFFETRPMKRSAIGSNFLK